MTLFRAEHFRRRELEVGGWPVRVTSYQLRDRWKSRVDNVSPGATVSRGEGATREEAEAVALAKATSRIRPR